MCSAIRRQVTLLGLRISAAPAQPRCRGRIAERGGHGRQTSSRPSSEERRRAVRSAMPARVLWFAGVPGRDLAESSRIRAQWPSLPTRRRVRPRASKFRTSCTRVVNVLSVALFERGRFQQGHRSPSSAMGRRARRSRPSRRRRLGSGIRRAARSSRRGRMYGSGSVQVLDGRFELGTGSARYATPSTISRVAVTGPTTVPIAHRTVLSRSRSIAQFIVENLCWLPAVTQVLLL